MTSCADFISCSGGPAGERLGFRDPWGWGELWGQSVPLGWGWSRAVGPPAQPGGTWGLNEAKVRSKDQEMHLAACPAAQHPSPCETC